MNGAHQNQQDQNWKWELSFNEDSSLSSPPDFDEESGPTSHVMNCDVPMDIFQHFLNDSLIDLIVNQTNAYAAQNSFDVKFSREDILGYLGMSIAMGIVNLPAVNDYWTREPLLQTSWFSLVMSRRKFKAISKFLHFADNATALPRDDPNYDKLWKI